MAHNEKAVEGDLNLEKAGEKVSPDMGIRLKKAREDRGLSLFDIYLRTNISVDDLAEIEEGNVIPPLGTVIKLAKALDMKVGYFISGFLLFRSQLMAFLFSIN